MGWHFVSGLFVFSFLMQSMAAQASPGKVGTVDWLKKNSQTFTNKPKLCKKNGTCALKSFTVWSGWFEAHTPDGSNFGTTNVATYTTDTVENLEQFAVVQFLQGCMFESKIVDGKVRKTPHWGLIKHFGGMRPFRFPQWAIDSLTDDPASASDDSQYDRFYHYLWNTVPGSYLAKTSVFYGQQKPPTASLYVKDIGSTAFVENTGEAVNSSVRFKTCVFKAADVPRHTTDQGMTTEKAIACFSWDRNQVYNHFHGEFEAKGQEIDSYCLK